MRQLTPRQTQILHMIQEFMAETGMPPTRAEIARELGFKSANAAEEHLRALQKKGVLVLLPGASRGIQLKDSLREQMGLPLVGRFRGPSPLAGPPGPSPGPVSPSEPRAPRSSGKRVQQSEARDRGKSLRRASSPRVQVTLGPRECGRGPPS